MTLTLHGNILATCTQRVLTVLNEKAIPYKFISVNIFGGDQFAPAYVKLQPFSKIPVLVDTDFDGKGGGELVIFESRAICKYLGKKFYGNGMGGELVSKEGDGRAWAGLEEACEIEHNYFNGPAEGILNEKVFKVMRGGQTDEANVTKLIEELDKALKVYDGILSKRRFIAGDEFSVADIFHLPYGSRVIGLGLGEGFQGKYANVKRWWEEISGKESWKKTVEMGEVVKKELAAAK